MHRRDVLKAMAATAVPMTVAGRVWAAEDRYAAARGVPAWRL
jgi:hypothetical protein